MTESDANLHNVRPGYWPAIVLSGIVVILTALNALTWNYRDAGSADDRLQLMIVGVWVFEPILFGVWTALGSGSIVTRLPLVIPCLLMLFVAPGLRKASLADVERREFVVAVLVGTTIFAVTTMLFLAVRWFTGLRIESSTAAQSACQSRVRFSMKYLLSTITAYAVLFGMATQLEFQSEPPPPPSFFVFGPNFYIYVFAVGGAIVSGILLPIIAVPLIVLRPSCSKRAVQISLACWFVVTVLAVAIFAYLEEESPPEVFQFAVLMQLAAAFVGLLVTLPMRWVGFRLVSDRATDAQLPTQHSAMSP